MVNAIASVQPLQEESGLVYFRESYVVNNQHAGGTAAGTTITAFGTQETPIKNLASNQVTAENLATTVAATTAYAVNLAAVPARPGSVTITIAAPDAHTLVDDGNGGLMSASGAFGKLKEAIVTFFASFQTAAYA